MGKPKQKTWPHSWKQPAATITLRGRSFSQELVVLPLRVGAATPEELVEGVDAAVIESNARQTPS